MNLLPRTTDDPGARRRLIVAAEVALVVLLVIVNIALWNRSSAPPADGGDVRANGTTSGSQAGEGGSSGSPSGTPSTATTGAATSSPVSASTSPVRSTPTTATPTATATATADRDRAVADLLGRARRVIIAVDTSQGAGPGLPQVRTAIADLVRQAPDGTTVGVLSFSAAGPLITSPAAPMTAKRRDALVRDIEELQPAAAGGRPLYDAMVMGYQHAVEAATVNERPLLVVVTNGPRQGGADLQTFVTFITAAKAQSPAAAYPLIVAVGPDVDLPALRTAAAQGAGSVVRSATPALVHDTLFASLAAAPIPPSTGKSS